ncbi:hypothetical protein FK529_18940 [Tsukamurella asaccharolytica]|uniref:Uncharacterized protein n=1 Tax=Tsukamurella asaccharolytica TaxID=2592067 RepID=A0A5C5R6L2_9ACTN|nr:hypothetical protein [Tsukamurella asaccharolytica]TWS17771.1 hypothetical protein FK529_18940 [Tsukamurella asaccharolytica]
MTAARSHRGVLTLILTFAAATWQVWLFGFTNASPTLIVGSAVTWILIALFILTAPPEWRERLTRVQISAILLFQVVFFWGLASHSNGVQNLSSRIQSAIQNNNPNNTEKASVNTYDQSIPGTDRLGFIGSRARCNTSDSVILLLRTTAQGRPGSKVAICRTSIGSLYYAGARDTPSDPGITIRNVESTAYGFTARNRDHVYEVSSSQLAIRKNGVTISLEPGVQYWRSR